MSRLTKQPRVTQEMVDAARTVLGDIEETLPVEAAIEAALGACHAFNVRVSGAVPVEVER